MTTPAAARAYEAAHLRETDGRTPVVHNPHGKAIADLPTIYGFNNGRFGSLTLSDCWEAILIAEDGERLGAHVCSSESYMRHDLAIIEGSCADRHDAFRLKYPDGYRMEFVGYDEVAAHTGLQQAFAAQVARVASASNDICEVP